ncbi:MAG: hypothetical protein QOH91_3168 [Mycobacterium sp.]|nr:hypothetical protein [Mycobacterium sp.]
MTDESRHRGHGSRPRHGWLSSKSSAATSSEPGRRGCREGCASGPNHDHGGNLDEDAHSPANKKSPANPRQRGNDATAVADIVGDVVRGEPDASLLNLAGKAYGNPFLVMELIQGLQEEHRISVKGGRASVAGQELPRRLTATMQERLDRLPAEARRVVQVASVLPDSFSAGLLPAMLEHRPMESSRRRKKRCGPTYWPKPATRRRSGRCDKPRDSWPAALRAPRPTSVSGPWNCCPGKTRRADHWSQRPKCC